MELSVCKTCKHHICVLGEKVLCGFTIDRGDRPIVKSPDGTKNVTGCPREKKDKSPVGWICHGELKLVLSLSK
jgi:hypothetical protein